MTPISALSAKRTGGFTLIELLVVLAIMSFAAVIAIRSFDVRPSGLARQEAAAKLAAAIRAAQKEAAWLQSPKEIEPSAVVAGAQAEAELPGAKPGSIILYPDGSSNGGLIRLSGRPLLKVEWLTGAVSRAS